MTKCNNAIDIRDNKKIYSVLTRLNYSFSSNLPLKLKYLNIGAGTTGTRIIHTIFCQKYHITSLHYSNHCNFNLSTSSSTSSSSSSPPSSFSTNSNTNNKLLVWYNHLTKCTINHQNKCKSIDILQSLQVRLPLILSQYEFISDTPIDMLFFEIYAYMKYKVLFPPLPLK